MVPWVKKISLRQARTCLVKDLSLVWRSKRRQPKPYPRLRKWGICFLAATLHLPLFGMLRVMEQYVTDKASSQVVGKQGADLTNQGKGALYLFQATLQPASNHRYVTKSFTNKFCPSTSSWPPEVFSGKLESYYRWPWSVRDYFVLQNRISYSAPPALSC